MQPDFTILTGFFDDNADLRDEYTTLSEPAHPEAKKLLAFWNGRPADGLVIGRDVPSRGVASLLSNISIYEPIDEGRDFRVRVAGASIRRRFGRDITGKLFSELYPPEDFQHHLESTRQILESSQPKIIDSRLCSGNVEKLHLEVVILPVFAPNRIDKWVLAGLFYFH